MKIGFFGDSFCSTVDSGDASYQTYIKKILNEYKAELVHVGRSGSSIGDVLMNQLPSTTHNLDICIFVWTDSPRLFNREVRNINAASADHNEGEIWSAAKSYYKYLYDYEFTTIQYKALLEYIDNHILINFLNSAKIIHLWSFGENDGTYAYRWKHGVEIRPSLIHASVGSRDFLKMSNVQGPNHISGEENNNLVFNWIKKAIDNYSNGLLLNEKVGAE